jgi:predicted adenylyl cyclase CyaB
MPNDNVEIEIKVKVDNAAPLVALMEKEGKFEGEMKQIDEYFTPAHVDYLSAQPIREWLRLRWQGDKCSINYKYYYYDENGKSTYCDEYESNVEKIDQMQKIFKSLGFKSLTKVEKIRKAWLYKDYEIALDEVVGAGSFIEIELKRGSTDPKKDAGEMMSFLKKLNVGKVRRTYAGYPYILMFPEKIEYFEE